MYELDIVSLPEMRFSHIYQTDCYVNKFSPRENFIEVAYIAAGALTIAQGESRHVAEKGDIVCLFRNEPLCVSAGQFHCHHTVGANLTMTFNKDKINTLHLPVVLKASCETEKICYLIDSFIFNKEYYESSAARFAASFLGMLCEIDKCAQKLYKSKLPGEMLYAERAKTYIKNHIYSVITQREIARQLGISPGYLCDIFRKNEGTTVIKYINKAKLQSIRALMEEKNISLQEASFLHGYNDPNYVSKLFRTFYGCNITKILKTGAHT